MLADMLLRFINDRRAGKSSVNEPRIIIDPQQATVIAVIDDDVASPYITRLCSGIHVTFDNTAHANEPKFAVNADADNRTRRRERVQSKA